MENYEVVRSSRKTLAIQIRDGRVIVRAPARMPAAQIERVVREHEPWIRRRLAEQKSRPAEPDEALLQKWTEEAKALLPERTAYFGKLMGLQPASVTINRARTRFGSCSSRGRIHFSCRLMAYPPEAVDYVVVHELAHLRYMNHGRDFYRLIETYLPDYRERRKLLK